MITVSDHTSIPNKKKRLGATHNASHVAQVNWRPAEGLRSLSGPLVFNYARWRKDWVEISSELAHGASTRNVVNSIDDAGSTRLG